MGNLKTTPKNREPENWKMGSKDSNLRSGWILTHTQLGHLRKEARRPELSLANRIAGSLRAAPGRGAVWTKLGLGTPAGFPSFGCILTPAGPSFFFFRVKAWRRHCGAPCLCLTEEESVEKEDQQCSWKVACQHRCRVARLTLPPTNMATPFKRKEIFQVSLDEPRLWCTCPRGA